MSIFSEQGSLRMTSGAIHATVPANDIVVLISFQLRLVPKSEILTVSSGEINILTNTQQQVNFFSAMINSFWYIQETYLLFHKLLTHTCLTAICPGLPGWAGTRKVKPAWILLNQERVTGSGISWDICKSAPRSRQITTPAPHHSVFYRLGAIPATQPTASKHWRQSSEGKLLMSSETT